MSNRLYDVKILRVLSDAGIRYVHNGCTRSDNGQQFDTFLVDPLTQEHKDKLHGYRSDMEIGCVKHPVTGDHYTMLLFPVRRKELECCRLDRGGISNMNDFL